MTLHQKAGKHCYGIVYMVRRTVTQSIDCLDSKYLSFPSTISHLLLPARAFLIRLHFCGDVNMNMAARLPLHPQQSCSNFHEFQLKRTKMIQSDSSELVAMIAQIYYI